MRRRRCFVVVAATVLAIYGLTAWLFWLPPIQRPHTHSVPSGHLCAEGQPQGLGFVPLAEIPDHLIRAVLAQEDHFYHHSGVDWEQLVRAFWRNVAAGEYRYGASTLTMQVVRELFLSKERSVLRKLREIAYALQAERRLSKEEILEVYLNVVEWGIGIHGVGAASCHYFGVPPSALDAEESVRLVAVLPSPMRLGPPLLAASHGRRLAGSPEARDRR